MERGFSIVGLFIAGPARAEMVFSEGSWSTGGRVVQGAGLL